MVSNLRYMVIAGIRAGVPLPGCEAELGPSVLSSPREEERWWPKAARPHCGRSRGTARATVRRGCCSGRRHCPRSHPGSRYPRRAPRTPARPQRLPAPALHPPPLPGRLPGRPPLPRGVRPRAGGGRGCAEAERRLRSGGCPARRGGLGKSSQTAAGLSICQQNMPVAASKCSQTNSFHGYTGKCTDNGHAGKKHICAIRHN